MLLVAGCGGGPSAPPGPGPDDDLRQRFDLRALGEIPYPPGGAPSAARIALGRLLFFDPILGGERDVACATCHHPDLAFADGRQFSVGAGGTGLGPGRVASASSITGLPIGLEPRNAQTILNAAYNADAAGSPSAQGLQFWDGRAIGLEEQARIPIQSRTEMAGDAYSAEVARDSVVARLRGVEEYVELFREAFPVESADLPGADVITMDTYGRAIAAYERELVTRNSPLDRYARGDDGALTARQKLGLELFFTKAVCSSCHGGPMFSDFRFHVLGVPQEGDGKDLLPGDDTGREEHTRDPADRYAFRTPTLRNVELTAPYMHDGAFATLEEVVRFYDQGASPRHPAVGDARIDPFVREPLGLTDEEVSALVAFLKALTDPGTALDPTLLAVPESVPSGLEPVFGLRSP
ncbi:MAG TPA: cytochrome c peroxidase [Gemmatimonadota bacterium]|nr:cytochrome c peroxidase [Gemmatimonadota bacterium]